VQVFHKYNTLSLEEIVCKRRMDEQTKELDDQYEYDGKRLARGSLRLGFRSLVPRICFVGDWSDEIGLFISNEHGVFNRIANPNVQTWSITCSVLLNTQDPFAKDELPLDIKVTEPFTPAGRTKVCVRFPTSLPTTTDKSSGYEIVFRANNNESRHVTPIIPGHSIQLIANTRNGDQQQQQDEEEDWLSCKRLVIPKIDWRSPPRLLIGESASNLGIGGKVWDGSVAMLELLFATEQRWAELSLPDFQGFKIVDLGAATGILGFGLALLKSHCIVINTDLPEVCPLLEINKGSIPNAFVEPYSWGEDPKSDVLKGNIDLILMCDVVYDETCYKPLLESLKRLKGKHVLMSHRHRNRSEILFFEELAKIGNIECLKYPMIREDDPYHKILTHIRPATKVISDHRSEAGADDVGVFRIVLNQA
jgi:hypothetical protein